MLSRPFFPTFSTHVCRWPALAVLICAGQLLVPVQPVAMAAEASVAELEIGLSGSYRPGFWTPVWVRLGDIDVPTETSSLFLELVTIDGDNVPVAYRVAEKFQSGRRLESLIRVGRTRVPLEVRVVDENETVIWRHAFTSEEIGKALPSTQPLLVTIGTEMTAPIKAVARELSRGGEEYATVHLAPKQLPTHPSGYDAARAIYLSTYDNAILDEISEAQWDALVTWVRRGGNLVVSSGKNSEPLFAAGSPLASFAPGLWLGQEDVDRTNQLETFAKASSKLTLEASTDKLLRAEFENPAGDIIIAETSKLGEAIPIVIRTPREFGEVTVIAVDLDHPAVKEWDGASSLLARLVSGEEIVRPDDFATSRRAVHLGYEDLSGQLRAAQGKFSGVTLVAFSIVAILIVLLCALVAPGDYFFLRHVTGRMHLTWVTWPVLLIIFSVAAVALAANWRSDSAMLNQVEVVDIDLATGAVRGNAWANLYSPTTRRFNLRGAISDWQSTSAEGRTLPFQTSSPNTEFPSSMLTWSGLPGTGLGGLETGTLPPLFERPYLQAASFADQQTEFDFQQLPLSVGATKSLTAEWHAMVDPEQLAGTALEASSTELLSGQFVNPLPVSLEDAVIVYKNSTYIFGEPIPAGSSVELSDARLRTKSWWLNEKKLVSGKDQTTPWDAESEDIDRIVQMLSFYEAAGGENYTRLSHSYNRRLDLSPHLQMGQAVLFAKTKSQLLHIVDNESQPAAEYNAQQQYVRIILPVANH